MKSITEQFDKAEIKTQLLPLFENRDQTIFSKSSFSILNYYNKNFVADENQDLTGYFAIKDENKFMVKTAFKHPQDRNYNDEDLHNISFINEYITAPLYTRLLNQRAPKIGLVIENDMDLLHYKVSFEARIQIKNEKTLSLRSQFLPGFSNVQECWRKRGRDFFDRKYAVDGIEKVFAAILFGGEFDFHYKNIGVIDNNIFAKVDHGLSGVSFFSNPQYMMRNLANGFEQYKYETINFHITTFRTAVRDCLTISNDEIETIIKARVYQLKKVGFDLSELEFVYLLNNKTHNFHDKQSRQFLKFASWEELENHYIVNYHMQRHTMKCLHSVLSILNKLVAMPVNWKEGRWLMDFKEHTIISLANSKLLDEKNSQIIIKELDKYAESMISELLATSKDENNFYINLNQLFRSCNKFIPSAHEQLLSSENFQMEAKRSFTAYMANSLDSKVIIEKFKEFMKTFFSPEWYSQYIISAHTELLL